MDALLRTIRQKETKSGAVNRQKLCVGKNYHNNRIIYMEKGESSIFVFQVEYQYFQKRENTSYIDVRKKMRITQT